MSRKSILRALEEGLAAENRRVLSDWRAVLILRRATRGTPEDQRRWSHMPSSIYDVRPVLQRLAARGELTQLKELPHLYEVTSPFARKGLLHEDEVIMEVHPYTSLSHASALAFHALTIDFPKEIHVILPEDGRGDLLPLGTRPEDWEGLEEGHAIVRGHAPERLMGRQVFWHRLSKGSASHGGTAEYQPHGYPIRVTTPERTLLDGLMHPEWSGGIENVLRAWSMARDTLNLNALVDLVQMFDVTLLRQRVGFILEELGLRHPIVDQWPEQAKRGGSSRLFGGAPFAPTFSERWKISINVPIDVLHGSEP
jgi:predicted transcriptional regulator of viral defense system